MKPYHWFQGASVRTLFDRLAAAGPDTARLEVHEDGPSMTLRVVPADIRRASFVAEAGDDCDEPIDDSRLCPPVCP